MKILKDLTLVKVGVFFLIVIILFNIHLGYWLLSDRQDRCYDKVYHENVDLNLYEKVSIYSIHLGICFYGWIASPEAWRQQVACTIPCNKVYTWKSDYLKNDEYIKSFYKSPKDSVYIAYRPKINSFGKHTAYNSKNLRAAVAVNGTYLVRKNGNIYITPENNEFLYPHIRETTYIGPFKFNESLLRYLQKINWLYIPKYKWVLN